MNILLVHSTMGYHGGPEELLLNLNRHLWEYGCPTRTITERSFLRLYLEVRRNLSWADVVCAISFPSTLTVYPFCNKPAIWICNELPETFYRWYKVPLFKLNEHVWRDKCLICSNKVDADEVSRKYKVSHVIPFGVDWDFYSYGIRGMNHEFNIVQVGYIGRYKDQLTTLDIFSALLSKIPEARLILAGPKVPSGTGPLYWDRVVEKVKSLGLDGKVTMTGQLSREEVRNYLYMSDVFIHPVTGTGGWLAPFEALSTGLPVVVSTKFYGKEFLDGFGVVTEDYVDALCDVYLNRERYNEMARRGSEWVKYNFTWKHYTRKVLEVLRETCEL